MVAKKQSLSEKKFSRREMLRLTALTFSGALLAACTGAPPATPPPAEEAGQAEAPAAAPSGGRPFEGQTLSVAGMSWMWESTKPLYEEFLEETGITLEVAAFGQQEIEEKLMQAVASNTYFADLLAILSNDSDDVWGADLCLE